MRLFTSIALSSLLLASTAHADFLSTDYVPLVGMGVGHFDTLLNAERNTAVDARFEYRFGNPLWSVFKPQISLEGTSDGAAGLFGTVVADMVIADRFILAPSFSAGVWHSGSGKDLGSAIQFREQIEAGYKFDNNWRLVGSFSHMSNNDIGDKNPGVESFGLALQVPADLVFPH